MSKLGVKKMILSDNWNEEDERRIAGELNDLILRNLKKEIKLNESKNIELLKLKWNLNSINLKEISYIKNNSPNLIIGSDCFYDKSN